jgi:hypothetical protein
MMGYVRSRQSASALARTGTARSRLPNGVEMPLPRMEAITQPIHLSSAGFKSAASTIAPHLTSPHLTPRHYTTTRRISYIIPRALGMYSYHYVGF